MGGLNEARVILTTARKMIPQNLDLWLSAKRFESRHGNILMTKALQECPASGILWDVSIEMTPRPQINIKSTDALSRCDHDPYVIATISKLFWNDRKVDKATNWLNRVITLAPDNGDF